MFNYIDNMQDHNAAHRGLRRYINTDQEHTLAHRRLRMSWQIKMR